MEDVSLDDVEEITHKWNELHPEEGLCGGLFKHVDGMRTKSEEKEKERGEMVNIHNCITLMNYANVNEIKAQKHANKKLIDVHNNLFEEWDKENAKDNAIREEEMEQVKSCAEEKWKNIDLYSPNKFKTELGNKVVYDVSSDEPWFMIHGTCPDIKVP